MSSWQEIIIEAVRARPCLWDKLHPNYKDTRTIKKNNWMDVASLLTEKTGTPYTGEQQMLAYLSISMF